MSQANVIKNIILTVLGLVLILFALFYFTFQLSKPTALKQIDGNMPQAVAADYQQCLILKKGTAILKTGQEETRFKLSSIPADLFDKINPARDLNIICDKEADYNSVAAVLDWVARVGLEKYRMLKM